MCDKNGWFEIPLSIQGAQELFISTGQNDTFICIFVKEKFGVLIILLLGFVPKGPIDHKPALV